MKGLGKFLKRLGNGERGEITVQQIVWAMIGLMFAGLIGYYVYNTVITPSTATATKTATTVQGYQCATDSTCQP